MLFSRSKTSFYGLFLLAFALFGWAPASGVANPVHVGWWTGDVVSIGASTSVGFTDVDAAEPGKDAPSESDPTGVSFADEETHEEELPGLFARTILETIPDHRFDSLISHISAPEIQPPECA